MTLRPSPFHVRTAERNTANAWVARGAFTLPAHYGEPRGETLAARFSAVMADFSAMARLRVHGAGAAKLLSAACATDVDAIATGNSKRVLWRGEGGGVRGMGVAARFGATNFTLAALDTDGAWFEAAARHFDATLRDETNEKGLLLLIGPLASAMLSSAGLDHAARLEPGCHAVLPWRELTITISRWSTLANALGGFEIACANDDAVTVFDRLWRAGEGFALRLAGQEALETLLLEQGVPIPWIDFTPAREAGARDPAPAALGLAGLVSAEANTRTRVLAGLELDSEAAVSFAPVVQGGAIIGASLRSVYSPALRRAIALAQLDPGYSAADTPVAVRRLTPDGTQDVPSRVVRLPFLEQGS